MSDLDPQDEAISQLRARADQAAQLERSNALKDAEIAVLRAGVPTGTKVGQAFLQELAQRDDVDFQDSAAVHKAAEEWGLWTAEGSDAKEIPAGQQQLIEARSGLQGATAPDAAPPPPADILQEGWEKFNERLKNGSRREDAAAEIIDRQITAAVKGDERALVQNQATPYGSSQRTYADRDIPFVPGRQG